MSSQPQENGNELDWMESFRKLRDASLDSWSKTMIQLVNTDSYAETSGAMLDTALTASAPFREALEKVMAHTLEQLSMPTRDDVAGLAGRLTNVEMRLDDLDAKLDEILHAMKAKGTPPAPALPENKQGPPATGTEDSNERSETAHPSNAGIEAAARRHAAQVVQEAVREAAETKSRRPARDKEPHQPANPDRRHHSKGAK